MPKPQPGTIVNIMREADLVKTITTQLRQHPNVWVLKTHGGIYMPKGTPDLIGCCDGKFFAIEVKLDAHGHYRVTPIQKHVGNQIIKAGGAFTVVDRSNYSSVIADLTTVNTPKGI